MTDKKHVIEDKAFHDLIARNLFDWTPGSEWEVFVKHETEKVNCTIYRKPQDGNSALYEYVTTGVWRNIDPHVVYLSGLDLQYRLEWDETSISAEIIEENDHDDEEESAGPSQVVQWVTKFPWPLSNREFLYKRRGHVITHDANGEKVECYMMICRGIEEHEKANKTGKNVLVHPYEMDMIMKTDGEGGTLFALSYADDLGGSIPKKIINWAASSMIPASIDQIHEKTSVYPAERVGELRKVHHQNFKGEK